MFAIGNEGPNTSRSPGNYVGTLAVGAIDDGGHTAMFSGSQHFRRKRDPDKPTLVAPGVDVISAKPGGGYQAMDGTSMATPHMAGVAALLLEACSGTREGSPRRRPSHPRNRRSRSSRTEAIEYNFFPNLGAVAVRASKRGLEKLLALPDVTTATVS